MKKILFIFTILFVYFSCSEKTTNPEEQWEFTFERLACFGVCPVYSFEINNTGLMTFNGLKYVKIDSVITLQIDNKRIDQIEGVIKKYDYFSFDSAYVNGSVTDMATIITSLKYGSKYQKIVHYLGDTNAPQELLDFENSIEKILEIQNLTGVDSP